MNFPGNCFYDHDNNKMWIDVPKNGSKSISHHLLRMGWKNGNYIDDQIYDYEAIVVVRDVVGRWKGSTIEICYHHVQYNNFDFANFSHWFDLKNFKGFEQRNDLHHRPTSFFTSKLTNITYIAMDSRFEESVEKHLGIADLKTINSTADNQHKIAIEPYVDQLLLDEQFKSKLLDIYNDDQKIYLKHRHVDK